MLRIGYATKSYATKIKFGCSGRFWYKVCAVSHFNDFLTCNLWRNITGCITMCAAFKVKYQITII